MLPLPYLSYPVFGNTFSRLHHRFVDNVPAKVKFLIRVIIPLVAVKPFLDSLFLSLYIVHGFVPLC